VYFKLDQSMSVVPITSADVDAAEVAWFSALCSDDYRYLGVPTARCAQAGSIAPTS
jgi:hypothetical protein